MLATLALIAFAQAPMVFEPNHEDVGRPIRMGRTTIVYMGHKRAGEPGYTLYVTDGAAKPKQITPDSVDAYCPAISSDGKLVAFMNKNDRGLWIVSADGTGLRSIKTGLLEIGWPQFSYDGKSVVFVAFTKPTAWSDIYIIDLDGSNLRNLTLLNPSRDNENSPTLSHDNQFLAYVIDHEIWVMTLGTGSARRIGKGDFPMFLPGNKLGFTGAGDDAFPHVVDSDGEQRRKISDQWVYSRCYFSSDGRKIAFLSTDASKDFLYTGDTGSGGLVRHDFKNSRGMPAIWIGN